MCSGTVNFELNFCKVVRSIFIAFDICKTSKVNWNDGRKTRVYHN